MVTHDIDEAIRLADRIYVLSEKPASLVDSFIIETERKDRQPGSEVYNRMVSRLYRLLS